MFKNLQRFSLLWMRLFFVVLTIAIIIGCTLLYSYHSSTQYASVPLSKPFVVEFLGSLIVVTYIISHRIRYTFFWLNRVTNDNLRFVLVVLTHLFILLSILLIANLWQAGDLMFQYYKPCVQHLLNGEIPNRDFYYSYSPLFLYFIAIPLIIVNHPGSILAFETIFMLFAVYLFFQLIEDFEEKDKNFISILVAFLPVSFIYLTRKQDEGFWVFFYIVALYFQLKNRSDIAGIIAALGVATTKYLNALFVPILFFAGEQGFKSYTKFIVAFIATLLLSFAPFFVLGADLLKPFVEEGKFVNGVNLLSLLRLLSHDSLDLHIWTKIFLGILGIVTIGIAYLARRRDKDTVAQAIIKNSFGATGIAAAYFLFAPREFSTYWQLISLSISIVITFLWKNFRNPLLVFLIIFSLTIEIPEWFDNSWDQSLIAFKALPTQIVNHATLVLFLTVLIKYLFRIFLFGAAIVFLLEFPNPNGRVSSSSR